MLYHLFDLLKDFDFPGNRLMGYLSFRAIAASVTSMLVALIAGKKIIGWLQRHQIGEEIRDLDLEGQLAKKGTPTMGGVIIILALLSGVLLFCNLTNIYVILLVVTTLWLGGLGFADDWIKVVKHNKEGMSERGKLTGQIALGLIVAMTVWLSDDIVVRENVKVSGTEKDAETELIVTQGHYGEEDVVKSTKTTIPFVKNHEFDYKWLSPFKGRWGWYCKWGIYALMIILVITACSNGVNLTDGMDGLAAGSTAIVGVVLGILAWLSGNVLDAKYLNIMYIPGTGEVAVFMAALVGALIGFLWYNSHPAQVFMGDTGSLALGGIIGVAAVLIRKELLIPVLCGIFFVESLSVLMQRSWFKYTKKKYGEGRRIFKMTPLHHHFQKEGIPALIQKPLRKHPESKIVTRFWIVGIILAVSTLALLKIR